MPSRNLTLAFGTTLRSATLAAQKTISDETVKLDEFGKAWTVANNALVGQMKDLLRNLSSVLADNDARWLSFGLQLPSTITTPGQPVNVTAHMDDQGRVVVQCDATPLATRYRTRIKVVGVDTDYRLAASSTEPIMLGGGVQAGQTIQIIVQAVNGSLQGVASEPIQFTVLLPVSHRAETKSVAPAATLPVEDEIVLAARNGHGSTNGNEHTNGSRVPTVA